MTKNLEREVHKIDKSFSAYKDLAGFRELQQLLKTYWAKDEDVRINFHPEAVALVYKDALQEILHGVLLQPNPELALREKLVDVAYTFGRYMSLILPPEPAVDPSGLRDAQIGVTGELRPYAMELVKAYESLPNHGLIAAESATLDMVDDYILLEYLFWMAAFNVLSKLRKVLDKLSDPNPWEYVALKAACSMWEQTHREAIDLPSSLGAEVGDLLYRQHSGLLQIIRSGAPDPLATWQASVELKEEAPAVH